MFYDLESLAGLLTVQINVKYFFNDVDINILYAF